MLYLQIHQGDLSHPVGVLEEYFLKAGTSVIRAAFAHSYFIHPDDVRERTPYFAERARFSRTHYPGVGKGQKAVWQGDGREVILDDNQHAQLAWERYTGRGLLRGTGYSIRHIWGKPWDPDYFTAGWNLCYMPFWAGMLTERQHPHEELELAIRQASWDLYFRNNPVCPPPEEVYDPGFDLSSLLAGQPILILGREGFRQTLGPPDDSSATNLLVPKRTIRTRGRIAGQVASSDDIPDRIRAIKSQTHQSWSNIWKAVRELQGLDHEPFGTANVENSSKSCVRRIQRETGLTLVELEGYLRE